MRTVTTIEREGITTGKALTLTGLVLVVWALGTLAGLPGCGTVRGLGEDISASSRIVQKWMQPKPEAVAVKGGGSNE